MGKLLKKGNEYGGSGDGNWLIQDAKLDTKKEWLIPEQPADPPYEMDEYYCNIHHHLYYDTWRVGVDKKYDLQTVADFLDNSKIKLEAWDDADDSWREMGTWYSESGNKMAADAVDGSGYRVVFDLDDVSDQGTYLWFEDFEFQSPSGQVWYGINGKIRVYYKSLKRDKTVLQPTEIEVENKITRGSDFMKQELGDYMFTGLNTADLDYMWGSTLPGQINPKNVLYDLRRVGTGELQVCQNEIVIGKVMRPNGEMSDVKRCMVVISGVTNNMTYYTDLPFKNQQYRVLSMTGSLHKYTATGTMASYPLPYYRNNNGEELKSYITNSGGVDTGVLGFKVGADIIGNGESTWGFLTIDYYTF